MATLAGRVTIPFIASEYKIYQRLDYSDTVLIAISQSGETIDTLQALRMFKSKGSKIIAISNVIASTIPRESDEAVYTRAGPEIGVAATKTFLTQVLALTMLTLETAYRQGILGSTDYHNLISKLESAGKMAALGIEKSLRHVERLVDVLKYSKNIYVLGRGLGVPLAYEAALKIKEVSYVHAEAYPAGESKHGPIALIERNYPVIFIGANPSEDYIERLQSNVMEMKARGAFTIMIGHKAYSNIEGVDYFIDIGDPHEILIPYAVIPPIQ
jgi:glucosamine--fructose-6-phosphate aminotransferase (isomerizing)